MRKERPEKEVWDPKGGEFEVLPMLVDIEEITGPSEAGVYSRPDLGNMEAKKAMAAISLDFIVGIPLDPAKLTELKRHLPETPVVELL